MPRFAANIGLLWPDRPLLQRIDAAARAGFRACEMYWPYETDAAEVARRCRHHGMQLLGINSTVGEAAALIHELGCANIRLQFDVYHVAIAEGDVLTKLAAHMGIVGNMQIAAVPSRAEPDEGEIAYPAIFAALDALGYAGWVGCEYRPRRDTDAGLRWADALGVDLSGAVERT